MKVTCAPAGGFKDGIPPPSLPGGDGLRTGADSASYPGLISLVFRQHLDSGKAPPLQIMTGILPLCIKILLKGGNINAKSLFFLKHAFHGNSCFLFILECQTQPVLANGHISAKAVSQATGDGSAQGGSLPVKNSSPSYNPCDDAKKQKKVTMPESYSK